MKEKKNQLPNKGYAIAYISFILFVSRSWCNQDIYISFAAYLFLKLSCYPVSLFLHFSFSHLILHTSLLSIQFCYHDRNSFVVKVKITNRLVDEIWKCGPETRVDVSVNQETISAYIMHRWVCVYK